MAKKPMIDKTTDTAQEQGARPDSTADSLVLLVRNTGRSRHISLTGTLLPQGQLTKIKAKDDDEKRRVLSVLQQLNDLAGRKVLTVEESA